MLTKIEDPSCLKTVVGGRQGHALRKRQKLQKLLHEKFVKDLAPVSGSSQMSRGCEESLGYRNLRYDLEGGMLEIIVEEVRKCVNS